MIDLDQRTVAVPATWDLPSPIEVEGYRVTRSRTVTTSTSEPRDRPIILGIIREAVKGYFKSNNSEALGLLWQDYNAFCQMPSQAQDAEYLLCRRFSLVPKVLRNNRWVLEFVVSTVTLDAKTFADYYRQGKVDVLADMIEAKRANRLTRQNRPTAIRVWRNETTDYQSKAVILELADPSTVIGHESLSHHVQSSLAAGTIRCQSFNGPQTDIPFDQIRLVLDTQITQDEHAETIIEPGERERLMRHLRDFIDEADIYGHSLRLAETPFDLNK